MFTSISPERKFLIEIRHVNCVSRSPFDARTVKVVWSFIYGTHIICIILLCEFTRYCVCGRDQTESLCVAQPWFDYKNISSGGRDVSNTVAILNGCYKYNNSTNINYFELHKQLEGESKTRLLSKKPPREIRATSPLQSSLKITCKFSLR